MSRTLWQEEFYRYGRPIIVTDTGIHPALLASATDYSLDRLLLEYFGPESLDPNAPISYVVKRNEAGELHNVVDDYDRRQAEVLKRAWHGTKISKSLNDALHLSKSSHRASKQTKIDVLVGDMPDFLNGMMSVGPAGFYVCGGKPNGGPRNVSEECAHRHHDFGSCAIAMQYQLRGKKKWTLQMPMRSSVLDVDDEWSRSDIVKDMEDGAAWPSVLTYEFEMKPGDLLIFFPQWWHNTSIAVDGEVSIAAIFSVHPKGMKKRSLFHETFWASTRCDEQKGPSFEHCWSEWFGNTEG